MFVVACVCVLTTAGIYGVHGRCIEWREVEVYDVRVEAASAPKVVVVVVGEEAGNSTPTSTSTTW